MLARISAGGALSALAALVVLALVLPASAEAQTATGEYATIEFDVLGTVGFEPREPIDAQVIIEAHRAISGRLVVSDEPQGSASTNWEFDVDLAAGTRVAVPVLVRSGWEGVNGTVRLESGGENLAEMDIRRFPDGPGSDQSVIATLGIDDPPALLSERGSERAIRLIPADTNPAVISRAGTIVATPQAVRELAGTSVGTSLASWVRGGGQLVLDGPTGSLDETWHDLATANPDRFVSGAGSVLYDQEWRSGVPVGGYAGRATMREQVQPRGVGASGELALLADISLPSPRLVTTVLVGYALLAGPLLFLVVRRRQVHRRIWLLLPAIAALFTAGLLVFGFLNVQGRTDAHVTIVELHPSGSRATSNVLVGSRLGATREVTVPAAWQFLGQSGPSERTLLVRPTAAATQIAVDLPPSGNTTLRFNGPTSAYDDMLRIEGIRRNDAGGVSADVVNASSVELTDAVGFWGSERVDIGTIPAGESVTFALSGNPAGANLVGELALWPRVATAWRPNGIQIPQPTSTDDTNVGSGAWTEWRVEQGTGAIPEHVIGVAAWTGDLAAPIAGIDKGNTALFVRSVLPSSVLGDGWISSSYTSPSQDREPPMIENGFFGWPQAYRFIVGPGADDDLFLRVTAQSSAVSVLVDGTWRHAALPEDRADVLLRLPADIGDEIIAQSWIGEGNWGARQTLFLESGDPGDGAVDEWGEEFNARGPDFGGPFGGPVPVPPPIPDGPSIELARVEVDALAPGDPATFDNSVGFGEYVAYVVELDEGAGLVASLRGFEGDAYLEIHELNGGLLDANDDFGQGLDSRIDFVAPEAMTVEVRAQGLAGQALLYELTLEASE